MRKALVGLLSAAFLLAAPAVLAQKGKQAELKTIKVDRTPVEDSMGAALSVRGNAGLGFYDGNGGVSSDGGMGSVLGTGANFSLGRWFGDLGIDYYDVNQGTEDFNEFTRTDLVLTGGGRITDWISAFGGYRQAWQGYGGLFDDEVWTESGFFAGSGVAFPIGGGDLRGGASLAYNLNKLEFAGGGGDLDYNGLSGKLRLSLARTPHAVELRFQTFKVSEDTGYLRETYAFVAYVFNWQVLNF